MQVGFLSAAALVLALSGCAFSGKSEERAALDADPFAGVTRVGEPVRCITRSQIRESDVLSDSVIDFRMAGGKVYRSVLPNRCPGLGFSEAFTYSTSINQLCNVEIIRVLEQVGGGVTPQAACGLGMFQEVEEVRDR